MYIIKLNERVRRIFNLLITYSLIKISDFSRFGIYIYLIIN